MGAFEALKWLRLHAKGAGWSAEQVVRAVAPIGGALPLIDFVAEAERCPSCEAKLGVHKSRTRTVVTLAQGHFEAREVLKRCERGGSCPVVASEELRRVVPAHQRYGYDLVVHVGLARYLSDRQRDEIRAKLHDSRGIDLSAGTVSNLCDRFLVGLERLHLHRAQALRAAMEGGYPIHLDATCERGRGGLFVALDGWRGWVLAAKRIPTEHQDHLQPLVDQTVARFGEPVAVVRDLGEAIGAAVEPLRQRGVPDLACHYHFLAAVGKKLLEQPYGLLRDALRRSRVRSDLFTLLRELRRHRQNDGHQGTFGRGLLCEELLALVLWLLEGDGSKDAPFPFSLAYLHFVRRCERAGEQADLWVPSPHTAPERRALHHLRSVLARLPKERGVAVATERLDEGWQALCELRDVLRLSNAELPRGDLRCQKPHLPLLELRRLAEIERDLLRYKEELDRRVAAAGRSSVHAVVLRYLHRYGARLFGHPARRDDDGRVLAVVARTNNVLEHLFGSLKQKLRRRLGRAHLARDLQQQPAQAALVANLRHPEYVRVLCGSLDNLPTALAALDGVAVAGTTPLVRDHRDHQLHRRLKQLLEGSAATPEHDTTDSQDGVASKAPPDLSPPLSELEGLTEQQLRAHCATIFAPAHDPRLPPPGGVLTRTWQGVEYQVQILERGFEYQGQTYISLTTIARNITEGRSTSGVNFFHLDRLQDLDKPPAGRRPAVPTYPLGQLAERILADLTQAGYRASTSGAYLGYVRRFANHHMRSPEEMGEAEIVQFLSHLIDNSNTGLGTYRAARTALRALYKVSLQRPREVEHIPGRPEALRELAAGFGAASSDPHTLAPAARDGAVLSAATVS